MNSSYPTYVPERFLGRTGYQIFVDRFFREGQTPPAIEGRILKKWSDAVPNWKPDEDGEYRNLYFYGGNLRGIISKLDYLKSLGFDFLYLSPISFTYSSHHYDVEDQTIIDPWIGSWKDFEELCQIAHSKGILICVDLVFNHVGIRSEIFQKALKDRHSRYHEWFEWDDNGDPIYWYGFRDMPQCNKLNPDYQQYAYDVCEFYIHKGADAIRFDLGENLPWQFMQGLRRKIKSLNPEVLLISEMWDFATHKENPQIHGDQVDTVMNYPMADAICRWVRYGNAKHFEYTYNEISAYPGQVQNVLWNFIDSHDTPRALNMLAGEGMNENCFTGRIWDIEAPWRKGRFDTFGFREWEAENDDNFNKENAIKKLMLASLLQYFEMGIPIVYYGTERGVTGYKDPFNRKPYPWDSSQKILQHYWRIGLFRNNNRDILKDAITVEQQADDKVLLQVRENEKGALILVMNRTEEMQINPISSWNTSDWREVCKIGKGNHKVLQPYSAIVYRTDN